MAKKKDNRDPRIIAEDFPDKIFVTVNEDGIYASHTPEGAFDLVDDEFHLPVNIMEYHRVSKPVTITRKFELS